MGGWKSTAIVGSSTFLDEPGHIQELLVPASTSIGNHSKNVGKLATVSIHQSLVSP